MVAVVGRTEDMPGLGMFLRKTFEGILEVLLVLDGIEKGDKTGPLLGVLLGIYLCHDFDIF